MAAISNRWMFVDPEPEVRGILLSDRVEAYIKKYNLLVDAHDFKHSNLKPASYTLTLGAKYYLNGETFEIGPGGSLVVPPNSFVIAGVSERVVLPHWCAARFGLRVAYVYKGLLMGAGPQVDPGFDGYLGCPLHNLTNCSMRIKLGEPFAWIDFTKTSRLGDNSVLASEDALLEAAMRQERDRHEKRQWVIPGVHDFECRLYETQRTSFENSLPPGETISSSVKGLHDSVESIKTAWEQREKSMKEEVGRLTRVSQRINVASVVGLIALFTTVLLTIGVEIWMPRKAAMLELQQKIETLERRMNEPRPAAMPLPVVPASPPTAPPKQNSK
jgi:deoxycytidine triphosphate deaminase